MVPYLVRNPDSVAATTAPLLLAILTLTRNRRAMPKTRPVLFLNITEQDGLRGNTSDCIRGCPVRITIRTPIILTEVFGGLPQSPHTGIVP
jgi:hypothetical protein